MRKKTWVKVKSGKLTWLNPYFTLELVTRYAYKFMVPFSFPYILSMDIL